MRADRAADLHLTRKHRELRQVEAGGCAPPIVILTERQADQLLADRQRAEYRRRADSRRWGINWGTPEFVRL